MIEKDNKGLAKHSLCLREVYLSRWETASNYFHGMCELPQQQDIQDAAGRIPGAGFQ